ncbi:NACHT domain-containing protein [Nocardia sp. NPDC057030]|uniref:NACHT domain-containing protein n=1 Tax=unclassified Nocardia TaxID=2637762 RepID=UPI00364105A3
MRKLRPDVSATALASVADNLADLVAKTEKRRLGELGVARGKGIGLRWNALVDTWTVGSGEFGSLAEVRRYFDRLRDSRLVIVGDPGSGKTVAALNLVLDLLDRRVGSRRDRMPVPVRLNASSWDPDSHSFEEWLARRIARDYSLRLRVARELIKTDRILPVLDGLDEMDSDSGEPARALAALDQLNEVYWLGKPVVVTCRADTYRKISEVRGESGLHEASAIALQALTTEQVADHLTAWHDTNGGLKWASLKDKLQADPHGVFARALRTPWMLGLTLQFLKHARAEEAAALMEATSREAIEDALFSALIPSAVAAQPRDSHSKQKYTEVEVSAWMRTLARHFTSGPNRADSNDFALDQIWSLGGRLPCRLLHAFVAAIAAFGAVLVMFVVPTVGAGTDAGTTARNGVVAGTLCALVCGIRGYWPCRTKSRKALWRTYKPGDAKRWMEAAVAGVVTGLALSICAFLTSTHPETGNPLPPRDAAEGAGLVGVITALVLIFGISLTGHGEPRLDEKRIIRDDALAAVYVSAITWLVLVSIVTVWAFAKGASEGKLSPFLLALSPLVVVLMALAGAPLGVALGVLIFMARAKASIRYGCARLLFTVGSDFASSPGPFLDWARVAGLLRVTGAAYQFRHQSYQEWLAAQP